MYINVFLCIFYSLSYFYGYIAFIYKKKCLTQTFCFYLCSEPMSSALHLVLLWQFLIKIIYAYILVSCTLGNVTLELVQLLFHCFEIDTVSDYFTWPQHTLCPKVKWVLNCLLSFWFYSFLLLQTKIFLYTWEGPCVYKIPAWSLSPKLFSNQPLEQGRELTVWGRENIAGINALPYFSCRPGLRVVKPSLNE